MTLAGDEYDIAGLGLRDRTFDRSAAVDLDHETFTVSALHAGGGAAMR